MSKVLGLREWLSKEEGGSPFDVKWSNQFLTACIESDKHSGDCTRESSPCDLCMLEMILEDYRKYCKEQGQIKSQPSGP